jgi:hypothetical protein
LMIGFNTQWHWRDIPRQRPLVCILPRCSF